MKLLSLLFFSILITIPSMVYASDLFIDPATLLCYLGVAAKAPRPLDLPPELPSVLAPLREVIRSSTDIQLRLVVGIGNAGEGHIHNRHNAGFRALDFLLKKYPSVYGSLNPVPIGGWVEHVTRNYDDGSSVTEEVKVFTESGTFRTAKGEIYFSLNSDSRTLTLFARHLHDVNETGEFIGPIAQYMGMAPELIVVIYDELDLAPFVVKPKLGASREFHNGLKSITAALGSANYFRVRVGVGQPPSRDQLSQYVLGNFTAEEEAGLEMAFSGMPTAIPLLGQKDGLSRAAALLK